jgi:hypothetical protein
MGIASFSYPPFITSQSTINDSYLDLDEFVAPVKTGVQIMGNCRNNKNSALFAIILLGLSPS